MRHRRSWFVPALLLAVVTAVGLPPGSAAAQEEEDGQVVVGRLGLEPCQDLEGAWCGNLRVPFDREDPDAGTVPISFEWYPAEQAAVGTIVAMEGGPGYARTGSGDAQPATSLSSCSAACGAPAACSWSTTAAPAAPGWSTAGRCNDGTWPLA